MKQDPFFKYLAAALIAAVILAFLNPTPVDTKADQARTVSAANPAAVSARS